MEQNPKENEPNTFVTRFAPRRVVEVGRGGVLIARHPTYRRRFSIPDHTVEQIRRRTESEDLKCMDEVNLRNALDKQLVEAFDAQKFILMGDQGEPMWIVKLWNAFNDLHAIVKKDRNRNRTHCEKVVITVMTTEMVTLQRANKNYGRWTDPSLDNLKFKLGDKMTTISSTPPASQAVVVSRPPAPLPAVVPAKKVNGVAQDLWAVRYPVDDEVGHKLEEVEKAALQARVSELVEVGIEPTSISVYKLVPVKAKISISFEDT